MIAIAATNFPRPTPPPSTRNLRHTSQPFAAPGSPSLSWRVSQRTASAKEEISTGRKSIQKALAASTRMIISPAPVAGQARIKIRESAPDVSMAESG